MIDESDKRLDDTKATTESTEDKSINSDTYSKLPPDSVNDPPQMLNSWESAVGRKMIRIKISNKKFYNRGPL